MRLLLIAAILPLAACQSNWEKQGQTAQASGTGATRSFAAADFTKVDLRGSDDVDVKTGGAFAVTAEGDSKVLDRLEITVVDGTLRVGRKPREGGGWFEHDRGVKVHVVMPTLNGASVSGSGNLTADRGEGDFGAAVAGSGNMILADLRATSVDLSIAGSGDLDAAGTTGKLKTSTAGSGDIDAGKLRATSASVSVAGSGNVRATVKGPATVSIVGSGDVELTGGAQCEVSKIGSGDARCS